MKIINTKVHGFHDYISWILLLVCPWIFEFATGKIEMWIPFSLGIFTLLMSLITNYEFGLFKLISMKAHLRIDMLTNIFLALSPWIFGFHKAVYLPHLAIGVIGLIVALASQSVPYTDRPRRNFWIKKDNKIPAEER